MAKRGSRRGSPTFLEVINNTVTLIAGFTFIFCPFAALTAIGLGAIGFTSWEHVITTLCGLMIMFLLSFLFIGLGVYLDDPEGFFEDTQKSKADRDV